MLLNNGTKSTMDLALEDTLFCRIFALLKNKYTYKPPLPITLTPIRFGSISFKTGIWAFKQDQNELFNLSFFHLLKLCDYSFNSDREGGGGERG